MNRLTQFFALGSCLLALIFSNGVRAEDSYRYYMGRCALAKQAGVKQLILTHISRRYREKDVQAEAQAVFENVTVARDFDTFQVKHEAG